MADYFRPDIASLPAYVAGRNPEDPEVIKVASNEMPFPTLPGVAAALGLHLSELNRYPDMGAVALKEAIAAFHNTSVANVAVGNGSVALIEQFLQAVCVPGAEVVIPWRSFEAYPHCDPGCRRQSGEGRPPQQRQDRPASHARCDHRPHPCHPHLHPE
ncbi:aminotransferase class I/II-fold pyridoxal phosphate-dependent enzyme [Trueperella pyogenes]|uniref:aminotransferase class I/II-fold pyridoxal phosphate-dependent enzyme n=1 Tax=Trueperella pyogenes TaxID=1661 RepID=UPI00345CE9AB